MINENEKPIKKVKLWIKLWYLQRRVEKTVQLSKKRGNLKSLCSVQV